MPDSAFPFPLVAPRSRRRRSPPIDAFTLHRVRLAVAKPLLFVVGLLAAAFIVQHVTRVPGTQILLGLTCGFLAVACAAVHGARAAAGAIHLAAERSQAAQAAMVLESVSAIEKSILWTADELRRGERRPVPDTRASPLGGPVGQIEQALSGLRLRVVTSLTRVHDQSQSVVLLEVLYRLAAREHVLVGKALRALSELEMLTDDPDLLSKAFEIDHLVTRLRRHVESTAVLGGQSLRSARRPVPVTNVLRGAISEVVQYSRVVAAAGSVGSQIGLPGHVGPDLTHLLAELIENSTECSDPAMRVVLRAQRVPAGLAIEVEDRAIPMRPETRDQLNHLLSAPHEVDVSGQVRAGQLGLLTAAKIAARHGLSVRLQESPTGGTTALVVVPTRLLVSIPAAENSYATRSAPHRPRAAANQEPGRPAPRPEQPVPTDLSGVGRDARPDAPMLPRRPRRAGSFQPPAERPQSVVPAARPDLAAVFRSGVQAGSTDGPPPEPSEPSRP